jgi:hypothetical protein
MQWHASLCLGGEAGTGKFAHTFPWSAHVNRTDTGTAPILHSFGAGVSDAMIRDAIDMVAAKNWTVDGKTVSLADVGYSSVGIDEGWEGCGQGVTVNGRKTQHYANGTPAINNKFPDMVRERPPCGRYPSQSCTVTLACDSPYVQYKPLEQAGLVSYGHSQGLRMGW